MTEPLRRAICVRALANDLKFLKTVTNLMVTLLGSKIKICELENQASHSDAMIKLKNEPYDFALFFAHGGSDYLRGGEYQIRATGENVATEKFLTLDDLPIFKDKVVFCMSCDSNGLAQAAIESGAAAFVGFDKIPFNRFNAEGDSISSHEFVTHCQRILAEAVKASLKRFVTGRATLDESVDYLRIFLVKQAIEFVRRNKSVKERREIAALLLKTKDGLCYHGRRGIRFEL